MTAVVDSSPLIHRTGQGVVSNIRPILEAVRTEGFWLSESLQKAVLDAVGE
jgi:predicted nucleic acid-binding protein